MKESCFEDYEIKMHGGNVVTNQDYEENISKMRVAMRKKRYLTRPETDSGLFSLDDKELKIKWPNDLFFKLQILDTFFYFCNR